MLQLLQVKSGEGLGNSNVRFGQQHLSFGQQVVLTSARYLRRSQTSQRPNARSHSPRTEQSFSGLRYRPWRNGVAVKRLAPLILALAVLAGCGESIEEGRTVKAGGIVNPWPLTVDQATLGCDGPGVLIEIDGTVYGLNGTAQDNGYDELPNRYWRDDGYGMKVNIGSLLDEGLFYCQMKELKEEAGQ